MLSCSCTNYRTFSLFFFFTNFSRVATSSQAGDMERDGLSPASTGISRDTANIFNSRTPRLQHKKQCVTQPKEELQGIFSAICLIHPEITIRKFLTLRCESSFVPAHSLSPGHGTDRGRSSAQQAQGTRLCVPSTWLCSQRGQSTPRPRPALPIP